MVLGWSPFKIVSDSPALHSRWLLLPKIEISSIVHCCFSISQNELKFQLQLHGNQQFNNILGFSVRFVQPVYSVQEYYEIKITSKKSFGGPLSKLRATPPFSINFRCQIENQVSDYRLLGASSFIPYAWDRHCHQILFIIPAFSTCLDLNMFRIVFQS